LDGDHITSKCGDHRQTSRRSNGGSATRAAARVTAIHVIRENVTDCASRFETQFPGKTIRDQCLRGCGEHIQNTTPKRLKPDTDGA
jgi:hypothetical protein